MEKEIEDLKKGLDEGNQNRANILKVENFFFLNFLKNMFDFRKMMNY
jgi:hypothetical protein